MRYKLFLQLLTLCVMVTVAKAQHQPADTTGYNYRPPIARIAVPGAMLAYGFLALGKNQLQRLNYTTKTELQEDHRHFSTHIDNYLQYSPAVAVYALNAAGIHGAHNFRDRTFIYGISTLFMGGSVNLLKQSTHELRPDGSTYNSFPSGHTATAFAAAEFMRMEYKDVSPWYGVAGYTAATATGVLRLYNNRHWVSDVVAGAGLGILSTQAAYWLYPRLQHCFSHKRNRHPELVY